MYEESATKCVRMRQDEEVDAFVAVIEAEKAEAEKNKKSTAQAAV